MKNLIFSFFIVALSGCAAMQKDFQDRTCNENGGYQRGMNDARGNMPMNQDFAQSCEPSTISATQNGYRKGYADGLAANGAQTPNTMVNVSIGGAQPNTYYCEVKAFTNTYSAVGPTDAEARMRVRQKCDAQNDDMFCQQISCRR